MMIASFFIFMLLHGSAVYSSELYPISVVEDIVQQQPEWSSDNDIDDAEFPAPNLLPNDGEDPDLEDLKWIKSEIVDRFYPSNKFVKDPKSDKWKKQPSFQTDLGGLWFSDVANRVKTFFDRNNDWKTTKNNKKYRAGGSCTRLLYITAARYLLVTHILHLVGGKIREKPIKLIPCTKTPDKKIVIPGDDYVCYPAPYGSATCTSDYDVGLIGNNAGLLVVAFNEYFQSDKGFGKPSELVFDTNVYAFTLEFALPSLFSNLDLRINFVNDIKKNEKTERFEMQELASAYYKVFKYNEPFFHQLVKGARNAMESKKLEMLNDWLEVFYKMHVALPMKIGAQLNSLQNLREAHNNQYEKHVKTMTYKATDSDTLAYALIYAAEAYHTRGAMRHIVGIMQMHVKGLLQELTLNDLWVSMIENWGESNKEYDHCDNVTPPKECFLKMSKYLWRMFTAMNRISMRLQENGIPLGKSLTFLSGGLDPTWVMMIWNDYKKNETDVTNKKELNAVLTQLNCHNSMNLDPCMASIQDKVMAYNTKLAGLVKKQQLIPHKINIGEGIKGI